MSFDQFNLHDEVSDGLRDMGFEKPTPVQESCIPLILQGRDILASAQTGTGKTAAFAIPVLESLSEKKKQGITGIRALIITPTRELAAQVDEAFFAIGYHTGLTTAKVYGGDDWGRQEKALSRGTNIIVATPGRLLDHIKIHDVDFSQLDYLILDEADRMLDMGFIPDITQIVSHLPKKRQTLLFSATLPPKIIQLASSMMDNPERVHLAPPLRAAEGVKQGMYYVEERDKVPLVLHLYEKEKWGSAIVFMSTKRAVDQLTRELSRKGASVTSIHGDRSQAEREKALESFRKGEYRIIVATDVMSRGIDVDGVSHVINFSVPHDVEDYVHRIGRTARAAATGDAITLVSGQDRRYMENILRMIKSEIPKLEMPDLGRKPSKSDDKSSSEDRSAKPPRRSGRKPAQRDKDSSETSSEATAAPDSETPSEEQDPSTRSTARRRRKPAGRSAGTGRGRGRAGKAQGSGKGEDAQEQQKPSTRKSAEAGSSPEAGSADKDGAPARRRGRAGSSRSGGRSGGRPPRGRGPRGARGQSSDGRQADQGGRSTGRNARSRKPDNERSAKERERKELFDNITSPDMDKVNKAVGSKGGFWSKVKSLIKGD